MQSEKLPRARGVNRLISLRGTSVDAIHSLLALIQFHYSPKNRYYEVNGYAQNGPVSAEGVLLVDRLFREFSATPDARNMLIDYSRAPSRRSCASMRFPGRSRTPSSARGTRPAH